MKRQPNGKHLTLSDRTIIESSLTSGLTFKEIAASLSKDASTISKEVRKRRIYQEGARAATRSSCKHIQYCDRKDGCSRECGVICKKKRNCQCFLKCEYFEADTCELLARPPYVCNGCDKKAACRQDKQYYRAKLSDDDYRVTLVSARQGINMSKEELNSLDELVSPLILKGQPISHIAASLSGKLPVCERTIYNYVDCGILTAGAMDLPRKVSYKPRKKHKATFDRSFRDGRGYRQFKDYMAEHPDAHIWEMDTVIGSSGSGKALLTMMLRGMGLMLIFLLPSKTQESVKAVFAHLKSSLGSTLFSSIFTAFLTDNGTEFFAWDSYLVDDDGVILSEIFFCDPNAAYQKGRIEKNHEYIRLIIPKGKSFAKLTDDSVRIIMNHINSTARPSLGGRTPQELGLMLLPKELFTACGLELIDPSKVTLKPALLKTL